MRAFLAVPADAAWTERCADLAGRLRAASPAARWTRPESWHLTLRFFGDIAPAAAGSFAGDVEPLVRKSDGGALEAGGGVVFPGSRRPRVLGIGFRPGAALSSLETLARGAEEAARRTGAAPETRQFRAHVTLARLEASWPDAAVERFLETAGAFVFPPWPLRACVLFESRLGSAGAVHTPLRTFEFAPVPQEVSA